MLYFGGDFGFVPKGAEATMAKKRTGHRNPKGKTHGTTSADRALRNRVARLERRVAEVERIQGITSTQDAPSEPPGPSIEG